MNQKIAILDYGMGNLKSVYNALLKIGRDARVITSARLMKDFEVIILPGVGAFGEAMENLDRNNMVDGIKNAADNGQKLIGICLGMQLLFSRSYEFGEHEGLDLIQGVVLPFSSVVNLTIPHMGWNRAVASTERYKQLTDDYYFVHSFYCHPESSEDVLFESHYGVQFCSGVHRDGNVFGLQFHPEKSQKAGLLLLDKLM